MPHPNWLPPLIEVDPWNADTFNTLYETFARDFKGAKLQIDGCRVWFYPEVEDQREKMFWHLTHREDKATGVRMPDLPRCARLNWFAAMIGNANAPEMTRWDYRESDGDVNTYLWLKEMDCLVLLRKYPDGARRLITGYHVETGTKRSLEKKYLKRLP